MGGACSPHEMINAYNISIGKPEGKRKLGIPRCNWKNNIKLDLKEIVFDDLDLIHLAQDRI
jgi:hypothetical protein